MKKFIVIIFMAGPVLAWTAPMGIPTPSFGIDETYRYYDVVGNRNGDLTYRESDSGGYYTHYVDKDAVGATDTDNPYGAKPGVGLPRLSLPRDLPPGSVAEIHNDVNPNGSGENCYITGLGTLAMPIFVRGVGDPELGLNLVMSWPEDTCYLIVEGITFRKGSLQNGGDYSENTQNTVGAVVRNCEFTVDGDDGGGFSMAAFGDYWIEYGVFYNNEVHDNGIWDPNYAKGDRDYGSTSVEDKTRYIWIVDNTFYHNESSGFMICPSNANMPNDSEDCPHHIYVGRNVSHHNKQSGPWSKTSHDVIFSQNVSYGHYYSTSSNGGGFGFQYDPTRLWFLYNLSYRNNVGFDNGSLLGIRPMADIYWIGNVVTDCIDSGFYINGLNLTDPVMIILNTINDCPSGIENGYYNVKVSIIDNIIAGCDHAIYFPDDYSTYELSDMDYNLLDGSGDIVWGDVYANLAAFQAGTEHGDNCVEADPLFVNEGSDNFHLQSGSQAINRGLSTGVVDDAFDRFEELYGIDIRKDFDGNTLTGTWEIGAFQYDQAVQKYLMAERIKRETAWIIYLAFNNDDMQFIKRRRVVGH